MNATTRKIIKTLKGFREVEAIAYGGAVACGCFDKFSDIDIYVFFRNQPTHVGFRNKMFQGLAKIDKMGITDRIDFFIHKGRIIHTWWEDINELESNLINKPTDYGIKSMLMYTKIVWDKKGKLRELRKKHRFTKQLVERIIIDERCLMNPPKFFRDVTEKSVSRKRLFFLETVIINTTNEMIKAIYALNRKYYYFYPQHLKCDFRRFKHVPRNAYSNINKIGMFSLIDNPEEKLTAFYELFWGTVDLVRKIGIEFYQGHIYPEYEDKRWYRKRIREISQMIRRARP